LIAASPLSGSGAGKGLLAKMISVIAFGTRPNVTPKDDSREEFDKRLVSALIEAHPFLFLDNFNEASLRSNTLASVMTERPVRPRVLGKSRNVTLNSSALVCVTGNGLTVAEDLARRFIRSVLDPKCEDPEQRDFAPGFLEGIEQRRAELLTAALTIW